MGPLLRDERFQKSLVYFASPCCEIEIGRGINRAENLPKKTGHTGLQTQGIIAFIQLVG